MAAALPYASDPNHNPAALAPAPAAVTKLRVRLATVVILFVLTFTLSVCRVHDDVRSLTFGAFFSMNVSMIVLAFFLFEFAPQGSPVRGRARLAGWLLTTTLTAAFIWKVGALLPLGRLAVTSWVAGAATVSGGFCVLFLDGDEKPSAGSLIMRDCKRDGKDL